MSEVERRALRGLELRTNGGAPKITGYAAVFNMMSEDLGFFREIIMPGAFDRALREGHDVRALWNHNPDVVLGRTKSGTLALSVDEKGLLVSITPPDTQAARDVVESIKRGDVDGMSFGFRTLGDNWRTEEGEQIRELTDVELVDVSPVAFPAYPQTQVSARALERAREGRSVPKNVSTKLADRSEAWTVPTLADFTGESWGNLSDDEKRRIAGHYAYAEEMPPTAFGSLHLPHHRASDGAVVFRGVAAAAGRLDQTTSIPAGELATVKAHLSAHYEAFGEVAPWNRSADPPEVWTPPVEDLRLRYRERE